jgi:hypothetical protein
VWWGHALVDAKAAVRDVVGRWIEELGCGGKAAVDAQRWTPNAWEGDATTGPAV